MCRDNRRDASAGCWKSRIASTGKASTRPGAANRKVETETFVALHALLMLTAEKLQSEICLLH